MRIIFFLDLGTPVRFRRMRGLNGLGEKACERHSVLGMKGTQRVPLSGPIIFSTVPLLTRGDMGL